MLRKEIRIMEERVISKSIFFPKVVREAFFEEVTFKLTPYG